MTDTIESNKAQPDSVSSAESAQHIAQQVDLLGGYAYQIIQQQSRLIFELRSQVLADTDIEDLHQMRIGTRRLRAALQLFADAISPDPTEPNSSESGTSQSTSAQLTQSVSQLTKVLGRVRDHLTLIKKRRKNKTAQHSQLNYLD